ncbi:NERD domain-containing protein kinase family protein [Echinimonas agarilytica]|uniref:NERD domain-containing serine/threonine-protein kinase n=1 Tax=Echinimonas agarilytica TaxID=1215918 RepID=A0AA42B6S6_9GAMM|nr:NERD domain-containing serine/threonine-protein kinase [Echinimonas agarilytica]
MARHIKFSEPVNESERWAFSKLAKELPEHYVLLTNIEVPTPSGQAMEVDALVVGEWGVYVVDIKGYIGTLDAGVHAWSLDGRNVDNSLSKANYVARILAGKFKHKVPTGVYAPWCQGMVFVTGRLGEDIEVQKPNRTMGVFDPEQIISALTKEWGSTSQFKHKVTEKQKEFVLDTIGQVAVMERRNNRIHDFEKKQCLFINQGVEVWSADYAPGHFRAPWILKILQPAEFESREEFEKFEHSMREELFRLQELAGCSGVPHCAPLIQEGDMLVLPIRMPRGQPMTELSDVVITPKQDLMLLRRAATSLHQIHRRGYTVSNWQHNCVFIDQEGDVEYIDIQNQLSVSDDIQHFAACFLLIAERLGNPTIHQWFRESSKGRVGSLDALRSELSAVLMQQTIAPEHHNPETLLEGSVIDGRYRLIQQITQSDDSEQWRAMHLQGGFECVVSVFYNVEENWQGVASVYNSLKCLYHPHVEHIIEFSQLRDSNTLYIARAWIEGVSLADFREYIVPGQPKKWFAELLSALQYLHSLDIYHGSICPDNIVVYQKTAVLANFAVGSDIAMRGYAANYADPELWAAEGPAERDLYGLVASFVDVLIPKTEAPRTREDLIEGLNYFDPEVLPPSLAEACRRVLSFDLPLTDENYIDLFDLPE